MEDQTEIKQRQIPWFRWIWRSGLLAVLILIVGIIVPIVQNGRAIQKLRSFKRISVETEPGLLFTSLPASWQTWLHDNLEYEQCLGFKTVIQISGQLGSISDSDFAILSEFRDLRKLVLWNSGINNAKMSHLKGLVKLEDLSIGESEVSDAGLIHLKGLTNLRLLNLYGTHVSDAGLIHLQKLTKLQQLRLNSTQVSDAGLIHLKRLMELYHLDLEGTQGVTWDFLSKRT